MAETDLIPLFPLSIVVFPGQPVPLHIFEERYKEMISDCEDGSFDHFGIVLAVGEATVDTGCTVVVTGRGQPYPDGSFDIVGKAERRFTTTDTFENRPYHTATVTYFDDEEIAEVDSALRAAVEERFARLVELAKRERGILSQVEGDDSVHPSAESGEVSFAIAATLGMDLKQKQQILEMRSESERLQSLVDYFDQLLPALQTRLEQKTRVKSNGQHREQAD